MAQSDPLTSSIFSQRNAAGRISSNATSKVTKQILQVPSSSSSNSTSGTSSVLKKSVPKTGNPSKSSLDSHRHSLSLSCLPACLPAYLPACLPAFLVSLTLTHKQKMYQYAGTLKKDPPHHCTLLCLHLHLYICLSLSSLPDGHRYKGQLTVRKIKTRYTAVDLPFLPYHCSPL